MSIIRKHAFRSIRWSVLALAVGFVPMAQASIIVYTNNFTSGADAKWSDASTITKNGETFLADNGTYGSGAGTNTLTLTGLQAHNQVTVSFDLYIIGTMDGNGPAGSGTDEWKLAANSNTIEDSSFANYSGDTQSYSAATPTGFFPGNPTYQNAPHSGNCGTNHLGYGDATVANGDTTYCFTLTFSDSASSLALAFQSLQTQSSSDEGWGLDNVTVSTDAQQAVPEPSDLPMFSAGLLTLFGFLGMGAYIDRRRQPRAAE